MSIDLSVVVVGETYLLLPCRIHTGFGDDRLLFDHLRHFVLHAEEHAYGIHLDHLSPFFCRCFPEQRRSSMVRDQFLFDMLDLGLTTSFPAGPEYLRSSQHSQAFLVLLRSAGRLARFLPPW